MKRRLLKLKKTIFLPMFIFIFLSSIAVSSADTTSPSSCVVCHTDEKLLTENLSSVKTKKSAMTSGAG